MAVPRVGECACPGGLLLFQGVSCDTYGLDIVSSCPCFSFRRDSGASDRGALSKFRSSRCPSSRARLPCGFNKLSKLLHSPQQQVFPITKVSAIAYQDLVPKWRVTMQSDKKSINFYCRSNVPAASLAEGAFCSSQTPAPFPYPSPMSRGVTFAGSRCEERGCVFPLASPSSRHCRYHENEQAEPRLFRSQQPSWALLQQARFGMADVDSEPNTHRRDRRRLAELWERFQSDDSA
jgi:hypothetical protein